MWVNVHPVPKTECLEFVKGSHLLPMFDPARPEEAVDGVPGFYGKAFPPMPDIDAEREKWDIATYEIEPGDLLRHPYYPKLCPIPEHRKKDYL